MKVPDDFAQSVKQQADIVRILGEYIRLRKSGAQNFTGLCPFHKEKTGSFSVHAARQLYYCFGCHEKGDVFSFIQKIENVSFPEAVKIVAQKCGIPLPKREFSSPEQAEQSRRRATLLELHEVATAWFEEQLRSPEGSRAREYLSGRGLTPEAIRSFHIGYAPDSYNALRDRLQSIAPPDLLRLSGLCSSKEQPDGSPGPLYARFRKRIVFPIRGESGRVIAFTARALDNDEKAGPKYLNSPETPLYSKGEILFNLDKAKQSIRQLNWALLVEGQMDCITAYTSGIPNVLATSGTAFTEMQVRLLGRHTKQVVVNFDPDTAGANAAEKSIALLTEEHFQVKLVTLDGGLDPDRFIRERGVEAYVAQVRAAKPHAEYLIDRALQLFPAHTAESKSKAIHYLLPHARRIPDPFVRDEFAKNAAQKLGIDSALVREELKQAIRKRHDQAPAQDSSSLSHAERVMLRALSVSPGTAIFARAARALDEEPDLFQDLRVSQILGALRERQGEDALSSISAPEDRTLLAHLLVQEREEASLEELSAALETFKFRLLESRQRRLRAEIAQAERQGDWSQVALWAAEKVRVDRELRDLSATAETAAGRSAR